MSNIIGIVLLIFATLVILEFSIHVIYHAVTGKAGLYDPAFSYLTDIWKGAYGRLHSIKFRRSPKSY